MNGQQRLYFSPVLRHFNGSTLSNGPHCTMAGKRDKNIVPRATTMLKLTQFPGFHFIICTNVCPFLPFHPCISCSWLSDLSSPPSHLCTAQGTAELTVTTPSSALLTFKVPPGEANPQHSCPPKGNKQTNSFHILLTIITEITQRGNTRRKGHSAD